MIRLEKVCISFVGKVILKDVSFNISNRDRIGIVGNNGAGKTCLLKIITGILTPDTGSVTRKRNLIIGYVPQEVPEELLDVSLFEGFLTAIPEDERDSNAWQVDVAISDLGFGEEDYDRPIRGLSGGWRRLFLICREALKKPDLLILDEPTNHLDIKKIFWLEDWLRENCHIPYALVSHDREFSG